MPTTTATFAAPLSVGAGITLFRKSNSPYWYINESRGGRRVRASLRTRILKQALVIAHQRAEEALSQIHGVPVANDPPFEPVVKLYKEHIELRNRPSTRRLNLDNLARLVKYVRSGVGSPRPLRLSDFNPETLEKYMKSRLERGLSPTTINRERTTWKTMFRRAARRRLIRASPVDLVDPLPEVRHRLPFTLTKEQISRLLEEAMMLVPFHGRGGKGQGNGRTRLTPMRDLVITVLNTGARLGEIAFLEWRDVDWELGRIHLQSKPEYLLKDSEDRTVAANRLLLETLKSRLEELGDEQRWVFPSQNGGPFDRRNLLREFKIIAERAGIPSANWRTLRNTGLSALARSGASMWALKETSGHQDVRTTSRFYIGAMGGESWALPELGRLGPAVDGAPHEQLAGGLAVVRSERGNQ
jgi:integrase